jgi:hypothetical protein
MIMYSMDMTGEESFGQLVPEGLRKMQITRCVKAISKSNNNEMFIITFLDLEIFKSVDMYAITTPGKRWFLKMILDACHVGAAADGVYNWSESEIIDKVVLVRVKHIPNDWTNNKGELIKAQKEKFVTVEPLPEEVKEQDNIITRESMSSGEKFEDIAQKVKEAAAHGDEVEDTTLPF